MKQPSGYFDMGGSSGNGVAGAKNGADELLEQQMLVGEALAKRYDNLLDGLDGFTRISTAFMLENYRRWYANLDETTRAVQIGTFDRTGRPIQ